VRGSAMQELAELDNLPRMSDIIGHKMVTQSGRLLGVIDDMLINGADGSVVGFVVGEGVRNKLENIFNPQRPRVHGYVRADADLHVGKELIVVPDDALIEGEPIAHERDHEPATAKTDEADSHPWEERALAEPTRPSIWTRRRDARTPAQPETPAEPRLKTETARPVENYRPSEETTAETSQPDRESEAVTTAPKDQSQA
jgi:sporulation protein YlmC with PRC-barrel domain